MASESKGGEQGKEGEEKVLSLENLFFNMPKRRAVLKWHHYFEIYQRHFDPILLRTKKINFLEIGILYGGSLDLWRNYLGPSSLIVGIDIDPACAAFAEPGTTICIGDQTDASFLERVAKEHGPFDIVLDDGGHRGDQQIPSFNALFKHVKPGGAYIVEDTHTAYWHEFGGGLRKPGTIIEFAKSVADELHAYYTKGEGLSTKKDSLWSWVHSVHFYDSIVVFEKNPEPRKRPVQSVADRNGVQERDFRPHRVR